MPISCREEDSSPTNNPSDTHISGILAHFHPCKQPSNLPYLKNNPSNHILNIQFSVYVGFFNAFSTLINQILEPYSFSETAAGICGALLIVVGLVTSAITSPLLSRHPHLSLLAIKIQVPIIALSYFAFIWAPQARTAAAPYVIASLLGASSFSLVPIALEFVVEIVHPVSPEITSVVCWTGGQLFGAVFLLIMDTLKNDGREKPPYGMKRALVFEAVVALLVVPLPLCLGLFGRKVKSRRLEADNARDVRSGG